HLRIDRRRPIALRDTHEQVTSRRDRQRESRRRATRERSTISRGHLLYITCASDIVGRLRGIATHGQGACVIFSSRWQNLVISVIGPLTTGEKPNLVSHGVP